MRQQEITLTNLNNVARITLQFRCRKMTVLNNTSNDVLINATSFLPSVGSRQYVVKAAVSGFPGNVELPQNSYEYCFFLPTTPALTDTTQTVNILLQGDDIETRHYRELVLNSLGVKKNLF